MRGTLHGASPTPGTTRPRRCGVLSKRVTALTTGEARRSAEVTADVGAMACSQLSGIGMPSGQAALARPWKASSS